MSGDLGAAAAADPAIVDAVAAALIGIRGTKSQAKVSMRAELSRVEITGPADQVAFVESAADDLRKAGKITGQLSFRADADAEAITVEAELAETAGADRGPPSVVAVVLRLLEILVPGV